MRGGRKGIIDIDIATESYDHYTMSDLWHTIISGIKQMIIDLIIQTCKVTSFIVFSQFLKVILPAHSFTGDFIRMFELQENIMVIRAE